MKSSKPETKIGSPIACFQQRSEKVVCRRVTIHALIEFQMCCLLSLFLFCSTANIQATGAEPKFEMLPLLSESDGQLLGSGLREAGSNSLLIFGSQIDQVQSVTTITSDDLEDWNTIPLIVSSSRYDDDLKLTVSYGFPTKKIGSASPVQHETGGWKLYHYTDNKGTSLPQFTSSPLELTEAQSERLKLFALKVQMDGGYKELQQLLGGLVYKGESLVGFIAHNNSESITIHPAKQLSELAVPPQDMRFRRNLHHAMLGPIEWPDGKPSLSEPVKPLIFRRKNIAGEPPLEITALMTSNRKDENERILEMTDLGEGRIQCLIDLSQTLSGENTGVYASLKAGALEIKGTLENNLINTSKGPTRIADLPLKLEWTPRYNTHEFAPTQFPDLSHVEVSEDGTSLLDWKHVDTFSIYKLEQFLDFKITITLNPNDEASVSLTDRLHIDLALTPDNNQRNSEDLSRSLHFIDCTIEREIQNRNRIIFTSDGSHFVTLTENKHIEIVNNQTLSTISHIDTSSDPQIAETFTCDSNFLYLLDVAGQRILSYTLPQGQFYQEIRAADLHLTESTKIYKIAAHRLAQDECVLLVQRADSDHSNLLRVDTRTRRVVYDCELSWGAAQYQHQEIELLSPIFAKLQGTYALFPNEDGIHDLDLNELPLSRPFIIDDDTIRYRNTSFSIPTLVGDFPEFRWADTHRPTGSIKRRHQVDERAHPRTYSKNPFPFVNEPSYFRVAPGQSLDINIPVLTGMGSVETEILAGAPDYSISTKGRLVSSSELEPSLRPDFILIQISGDGLEDTFFWTVVDHR